MTITKEWLKEKIQENVKTLSRKTIKTAAPEQLYEALAFTVRDVVTDKWIATHDAYFEQDIKLVYYLSMEFLTGRFLGNTVLNLSLYQEIKEVIEELGFDYNLLEDSERDPGLGNGGLGRLAACFLDSLSTLQYPAYGCGIRYHYGIFEQKIENGFQVEKPDNWLENGDLWGVKRSEYETIVKFGGNVRPIKMPNGRYKFEQENHTAVLAVPYDYPVLGYGSNTVNTLRLWDATAVNNFDLSSFNAGDYNKAVEEQNLARVLSEVLYPADDNMSGKELRLKQQYFFISATVQRVVARFKKKHTNFAEFPDKVAFQLNDTHPTVTVAELMRILIDENELSWEDAWQITVQTCAYTNHTIMSEALEKWPVELFSRVLPRLYMIVEEVNRRFCVALNEKFGANPDKIRSMAVIADGNVRMAHLAIVGSHSVNGVAALHTEILQKQELKDFYEIYPQKFNNKTNGITQRRWLAHANPRLSGLITETIGDKWITDLDELNKLVPYSKDKSFQEKFMSIKRENKADLAKYIKAHNGISVDPSAIFDIQVKRLHEYKRQLMNILHVLDLYNRVRREPGVDIEPRVFIFSAKASASYRRAKLIIKLINNVANLVNNDPVIEGRVKVLFIENYRVSLAERLIPACDVSEQISTAGKEASGTGNMKFMLNGAVTIGTLDGANVEMLQEVGKDNIYIFGLKASEIINLRNSGEYSPWDLCNMNQSIRMVMTQLINGSLSDDRELFRELYDSLLNGYGGSPADEYFILADFDEYAKTQEQISQAYKDKAKWAQMAVMNTAKSGKFSSDRTIEQYATEIWDLKKVPIKLD